MAGSVLLVRESARSRNFLWGFLSVVFGIALVRGHLGAETTSGRIAVDVFMGLFFGLSVLGWVYFNRHPATLQISSESIVHRHRGQSDGITIPHTGELYVSRRLLNGKHPIAHLRVVGSDAAIPMGNFRLAEIQQASLATGWRWAEMTFGDLPPAPARPDGPEGAG